MYENISFFLWTVLILLKEYKSSGNLKLEKFKVRKKKGLNLTLFMLPNNLTLFSAWFINYNIENLVEKDTPFKFSSCNANCMRNILFTKGI